MKALTEMLTKLFSKARWLYRIKAKKLYNNKSSDALNIRELNKEFFLKH